MPARRPTALPEVEENEFTGAASARIQSVSGCRGCSQSGATVDCKAVDAAAGTVALSLGQPEAEAPATHLANLTLPGRRQAGSLAASQIRWWSGERAGRPGGPVAQGRSSQPRGQGSPGERKTELALEEATEVAVRSREIAVTIKREEAETGAIAFARFRDQVLLIVFLLTVILVLVLAFLDLPLLKELGASGGFALILGMAGGRIGRHG